MSYKVVEIILLAIVEAFIWIWFSFGLRKLGFLDWIDRKIPPYHAYAWCDYCYSFWALIAVHAMYSEKIHLYACPFVASALVNILLKRHYKL